MKTKTVALLMFSGALLWAQTYTPPASPAQTPPAQLLSADQLDNLVAPIALYPDPLLGQTLAASTYPLEIVEAEQWLQQNGSLRGAPLMDAARQQNWDASVQALVAFPDALALLNRDIRWTTDLGNAFLAQQPDVMAAVQRLRARAEQNGRLASNAQQTVSTQTNNGQNAVVIEPADPQVIYVPVYSPEYIWGPPAWGYYPSLWYPSFGFGFGPGIFLSSYFPGWAGWGWGGWGGGWGWDCGWFGGGLYMNSFFFNHYGFRGGLYGRGFGGAGRMAWQHDPYFRAGVPYANRSVAARYNNSRFTSGRLNNGASFGSGYRGFGNTPAARGFGPSGSGYGNRGVSGANPGNSRGYPGQTNSRAFTGSNPGYNRGYSGQAYSRGNSAPASRGNSGSGFNGAARSYSAPRAPSGVARSYGGNSGGAGRSFSPSFSGGARSSGGGAPSFGGGGGARSFSGGGGARPSGGGGGARPSGGGGGNSGGGHGRR
jgi:hypothetical protein